MMRRSWIAVIATLLIAGCTATKPDSGPGALPSQAPQQQQTQAPASVDPSRRPVTILVSIDGFRPDYLDRGNTPRLDALARSGVRGSMRPAFPTKTFPNHWTIVTGQRPDRHGIVGNRMEDQRRPGETFTMATADPFWWTDAAPLWVDAERAGIRTATMFWPGSTVSWNGTRPRDWEPFDQNVTPTQRVDKVVGWMRRPADSRPAFVTLYFDTVDTAGHEHGPNAPETVKAIRAVDAAIGRLVEALQVLGQPANLVILSDHGMAATPPDAVIALDRIADPADFRTIETGPYASIEPLPGREQALAKALLSPHDHMRCWRKADIPPALRYGTHPRIPRFLCLAEPGWRIFPSAALAYGSGGDHGYDNQAPDMAAMFIANGPAIRTGLTVAPFDNVDVHPLLARLIGIPSTSEGDARTLMPILTGSPED